MVKTKQTQLKKYEIVNGILMKADLTGTLKMMEHGEVKRFHRSILSPTTARSMVANIKRSTNGEYSFTTSSEDDEQYCIVKRL